MDNKMNYGEAREIRKTGLLNQITERLLDEQGIGESFGKSISSVTRAKLVGLKEKFDPVNIARFATGGSNLATVLVGRLLGRSSDDLNYFVNKGKGNKNKNPLFLYTVNQNIQNAKVGDGYADILGKLYTLFKKNDEQEVLLEEMRKNFQEEHDMENERRSREITSAIRKMSRRKGAVREIGPTPTKEPTTEVPAETPKPTPTSKIEKIQKGIGKTFTFVKEHWKPIVVGGIAAGVATGVKAKIGSAESGSYNVMNIAPGETRKESTFDLENMTIDQLLSFQQKRGAKYGGKGIGKAAGKYQMMPSFIKNYAPKALGPNWQSEKFSATNQERIMDLALQDYANRLKRANVPVNDATLYMVHFTGNTKLASAIMTQPDNTPMRDLMTPIEASQNQNVAKLTVGQYRKRLQKQSGFNFSDNDVGQIISEASTQNRDMKGDFKQSTSALVALKKQVVNVINSTTTVLSNGSSRDESEFVKKQAGK